MKMRLLREILVLVALIVTAGTAPAQSFPEQPVTLICPWPAGGTTDVIFRVLAEGMSKHLGQRVVVDNKPGASGTLGAVQLTHAKPDGYTIAQMPITVFRLPHMQKTTYDPMTDFTWIAGVSGYTFGVVVRADAPWKTWQEFIAHVKANPGQVSYATPGYGTTLHITMDEIGRHDGLQWVHVPYKGTAETIQAVMGGHVQALADSTGWAELVDAGKLRLLAIWNAERSRHWPDVPTLKELGYDLVVNSPYGIAGPKGMDPKTVATLNEAIRKAMDEPAFEKLLAQLDQVRWYRRSDEYAGWARETFAYEKTVMERYRQ
ncbi:MAG TPA: tripartite tricarboxylate transporter substrate binding protein [Casimicrobiaceae bacterium]|nr:tripartite tricarboxylate transporter substrate binding protein [Casimicrobiaceae bacterium]